MSEPFARFRHFLRELRRRKVYRVAATYAVVGFVLIQVADLTFVRLGLPAWTVTLIIVLVAVGFPLVLVGAWAFEMTPEGMGRTPEAEPEGSVEEEPAPAEARTRTAYKILVGLGLVATTVVGGWYLTGGGGESPDVSEGTVAVLPFEVSGSGAEEWRDGMVSLLSTGLDGAAGLRAIADRTVFAAWEQRGMTATAASTDEALAVARRIGARYAVLGTAARLGSQLQLSAAAYETTSGERLGQVEVSGAADSVTALAGELSRRVLGMLAAETGEGLQAADLASVMTRSDTALRAFLAGERHLRNADWESAAGNYEAAIRADSSFALPYVRLARHGFWHGEFRQQYLKRAREFSDQLPERLRRFIQAMYLARIEGRTVAAADSLRRLTDDYPDDPLIWESLGELIAHSEIPKGQPEVERTHERAVELDPGYAPNYDHYVEAAFHLQRDSGVVARRVAEVPNEQWRTLYRLGVEVLYGDSTRRHQAISAYDTVSIPSAPWPVWAPYVSPQYADELDTVLRRVLGRNDIQREFFGRVLVRNAFWRGQTETALAEARRQETNADATACLLAEGFTIGRSVPDSAAAGYLAPENLPSAPSLTRLRCSGLYLAESDRPAELDRVIDHLRAVVDTVGPAGVPAGHRQAVVRELRGYRIWKKGQLQRAAGLWDQSNASEWTGALWRGDLYRQLEQLDTAEGWYLAAWIHPVAHERLGQLYEQMGRPEAAVAAYRRFLAAWGNADPELQDRVAGARERLRELTRTEDTPND